MRTRTQQGTALVTGASSGIGRELAKVLAANGHDLVLVARREPRLREIAEELVRRHHVTVAVLPKDLALPTAAEEIYAEVQRQGIEVQILVDAAGFNVYGPFASTALAQELAMIQVNLVALTSLTKLFVKHMLQRRSGAILNVASTGSFSPAPLDSVYCATKAHVLSFSEGLSEELQGTGVTVTALCPGPTATEFAARAEMLETNVFNGRLMSASAVASIGYRALMQHRVVAVTGMANKIMIFAMRFTPRSVTRKIARRMLSKRNTSQRRRAANTSGSHADQANSPV